MRFFILTTVPDINIDYFECRERSFSSKYCWEKADHSVIDEYKQRLDESIGKFAI